MDGMVVFVAWALVSWFVFGTIVALILDRRRSHVMSRLERRPLYKHLLLLFWWPILIYKVLVGRIRRK